MYAGKEHTDLISGIKDLSGQLGSIITKNLELGRGIAWYYSY
jgi:hypothetical protein